MNLLEWMRQKAEGTHKGGIWHKRLSLPIMEKQQLPNGLLETLFDDPNDPRVLKAQEKLFKGEYSDSLELFLTATQDGNVYACSIASFCYEFGLGVDSNILVAEAGYMVAANYGIPLAQSRLAFLRKYGRPGVSIDKTESIKWHNALAAQGPVRALEWLSKAASAGLTSAKYVLGICYQEGLGCNTDEKLAFLWYKSASNENFSKAHSILGFCYGEGLGTQKDPQLSIYYHQLAIGIDPTETVSLFHLGCISEEGKGTEVDLGKALEYYQRASDLGNAYAQSALGYFNEYGLGGLESNSTVAADLYRRSADQGYAWAQTNLGFCYQNGIGVVKDLPLAAFWYSKASKQGNSRSIHNLGHAFQMGLGVPRDPIRAIELFKLSASLGYVYAFHSLGYCYQHGIGVSKDPRVAFSWYEKGAMNNHSPSQLALAFCYKSGFGVSPEPSKALFWFSKAAQQNCPVAQNILGNIYDTGYADVTPDSNKAVFWYQRSALLNNPYAQCNLGYCYEQGIGIDQNFFEAYRYYTLSAQQGHARAMDKVGLFYLTGKADIVPPNPTMAVSWFQKAAELGHLSAQIHLGECFENGVGVEKRIEEAILWYQRAASKGRREAIDKMRSLLLRMSLEHSDTLRRFGHTAPCA